MSDFAGLVASFEDGTLDNCDFGHHDHVRVIWTLVNKYGALEAVRRFEECLKRITITQGAPEKYHATITHAMGFLVGERLSRQGKASWDEFMSANPDLFDWPNTALGKLYPGDTLQTDEARQYFVLPTAG